MPVVRSITLTITQVSSEDLMKYFDIMKSMERFLRDYGINVWTWRLTLPIGFNWESIIPYCKGNVLINAYHAELPQLNVEDLAMYLRECRNGYAALLLRDHHDVLDLASRLYLRLWDMVGEDSMARVGISLGDYLETPYYPLSTAFRRGFSVALRYVDLLHETPVNAWINTLLNYVSQVHSVFTRLSSKLGINFLGIDFSLSPWLNSEESIIGVIESKLLDGRKVPSVGLVNAVNYLNDYVIGNVRKGFNSLGFNEVMLPVAEDPILIQRVQEGYVRLSDLIMLSTFCISGLDMVVVESDPNIINAVFRDMSIIHRIKGKVLGIRLIPTTSKNGVKLKHFGFVPTIKA